MTRTGAWIFGVASVVVLAFGIFAAVSLWSESGASIGSRIFIVVWLALFVLLGGNNLRICLRRTSTTFVPPGVRIDLRTPLFRITPLDD